MNRLRGACVADLAWNEVQARLLAGAVPVLTVGAGSKQHGYHLPLDCTQAHGGHGDEAETALMCFMAPDCVDMRQAQAFDQLIPAGILSRQPCAPTYTPQGVWGRPDLGTPVAGRAIAQAMLADINVTWDRLHADH
jgi:creatinine amidohydrolase/Fe(II)-dependent formamide hydrolase-like protein